MHSAIPITAWYSSNSPFYIYEPLVLGVFWWPSFFSESIYFQVSTSTRCTLFLNCGCDEAWWCFRSRIVKVRFDFYGSFLTQDQKWRKDQPEIEMSWETFLLIHHVRWWSHLAINMLLGGSDFKSWFCRHYFWRTRLILDWEISDDHLKVQPLWKVFRR